MEKAELVVLLESARSRGEIKRLGKRVDREPEVKALLLTLLKAQGRAADPELPGKKLVRVAKDRSAEAQVRTNPIRVDEAFDCVHCGAAVAPGGAQVRDHCPVCLRSLHVDIVPGDRANLCGGILDPVGTEIDHGAVVIRYRCRSCGKPHRVRAHEDDDLSQVPIAPG